MKGFIGFFKSLPRFASHPWYPVVLALTAFLDYIVFVIPLDAIVVASVSIKRSRWFIFSLWANAGSTAGAAFFAWMIHLYGFQYIENWIPGMLNGQRVVQFGSWLQGYGIWALIGIGMIPINQHPAVAIAALAKVPVPKIALAMFIGRMVRYGVYTWLIGHARQGLGQFFRKDK